MYESITANIMGKDVKETIAFYETALGFQKVVSVPEEGKVLNLRSLSEIMYLSCFRSRTIY